MKIKINWKSEYPKDEIKIESNPINKGIVQKIESIIAPKPELLLIDWRTDDKLLISIDKIESIESFAHISKVKLIDFEIKYHLNKRLKELEYLEEYNFQRINNSTILNLNEISVFSVITNARLEIKTIKNNSYIVSRHYSKIIKERLKW